MAVIDQAYPQFSTIRNNGRYDGTSMVPFNLKVKHCSIAANTLSQATYSDRKAQQVRFKCWIVIWLNV